MGLINKTPRINTQIFTVRDVVDQLQAFNAAFEASDRGSVTNCNNTEAEKANYRKSIREHVVNCKGRPTELDFFEKVFGAPKPQTIGAAEHYIKYNTDKDYNIVAAAPSVGNAPGAATTFTLMKSIHSVGGKYSNVVVGGSIFIYEDREWVIITAVDKATDYAHVVTVVPFSPAYTVNIRSGKKMMFSPVRIKDAYSCAAPSSSWDSPGYFQSIKPISFRKDWELPLELEKAYRDIFQFAILFDKDGNERDAFVPYNREKAREEMKLFKNLMQFVGTKMTNPALVGSGGITLSSDKYSGFDGYLPTMRYGGGTVYEYDPANGFSLEADFMPIILRQDALKRCKEFTVLHGLPFMAGLQRANAEVLKQSAGQNNLAVYAQRLGTSEMELVKQGIKSYSFLNHTLYFKLMDALSDSRLIGNDDMPSTAMMIPMEGVYDSAGNAVPAIEYFIPQGKGANGSFFESDVVDHRNMPDHCEKLSGYMSEDLMMAIHCPNLHILLSPRRAC